MPYIMMKIQYLLGYTQKGAYYSINSYINNKLIQLGNYLILHYFYSLIYYCHVCVSLCTHVGAYENVCVYESMCLYAFACARSCVYAGACMHTHCVCLCVGVFVCDVSLSNACRGQKIILGINSLIPKWILKFELKPSDCQSHLCSE